MIKAAHKKGFTLIELLVVISVIGILAAIITVSFTSAQKQARDTARKSDEKQYQNALEVYASKNNGMYPMWSSSTPPNFVTQLCPTLGINSCPQDPKYDEDDPDPAFPQYGYQTDGAQNSLAPTATQYVIWAKTEAESDTFWTVCSNGSVFTKSTYAPTLSDCN